MTKQRFTPAYPAKLRERGVRLFRANRADHLVVVLPEGVRKPEGMQHHVSEAVGFPAQVVAVAVDALSIEAGDPAILEEAFRPNARVLAVLRGVRQTRDLLAESGGA